MSAGGKAQSAQGESLLTFLTSLASSVVLCGLVIGIDVVVKPKFLQECRAGSHLSAALRRQTAASWPRMILFPMPDPNLQQELGLENYLFDRYIHTMMRIFIPLAVTVLPVLLPVNLLGGKNTPGGVRGLDRLSFANVGFSHSSWYWVHLLMASSVSVFVCLVLQFELQSYARFQDAFTAAQTEGAVILISSLSRHRLTSESIQHYFGDVLGGVRSVQVNRDYRIMYAKLRRRAKLIATLEAAETSLIRSAQGSRRASLPPPRGADKDTLLWRRYLRAEDRPSMRLPLWSGMPALPFIGTRVDAIYYCRSEIARLSLEIGEDLRQLHLFRPLNSAFVQFNRRLSTPLPLLALKIHTPPSWTLKHGAAHKDIIWSNVPVSWWEHSTRTAIVYLAVAVLVLGFGLPVTAVGSLSQVSYLTSVVPALSWVGRLPSWLLAFLQGVLPPAMLALVTAMVPTVLRTLATLQGFYSRQAVEAAVQSYYFAFIFVQVFLVVSLSASVATVAEQLRQGVQSIPALLVQGLPRASNYFFSYLIIHTAATVTSTLILPGHLLNLLISPLLDASARQKWSRREDLYLQKWGTFVPVYTNAACIGLIYSVISPLILVVSGFVFGSLWALYRRHPPRLSENDRGQFYPIAIHQIFAGLYFMQLSLAALFFLVRDSSGIAPCTRQASLMIAAVAVTAIFHSSIDYRGRLSCRLLLLLIKSRVFHRRVDELQPVSPASSLQIQDYGVVTHNELTRAGHVIWLPRDNLGIAANEVYHMKHSKHLAASTNGAHLDSGGRIVLESGPPDWQG